jgi:P4 family phage/plasmid primase-like protien
MKVDINPSDIADTLKEDLCWASGIGWMLWNGEVWNEAQGTEPVSLVSRAMDEMGHAPLTARQIVHQLQGVLEIGAQSLDAHPHLLNVQNGVVNLSTGELHPHDPTLRLTKVASVDYDPEAQSNAWDEVLSAIPAPARNQLQTRIAGAVAGGPLDDVTLIHGPGASGKSTFVQAIRSALGSYTLATDGSLRDPLELLDLRGTRLLVMDDAGPGDMDRVKRLTSVELVHGRRMRQGPITFKRSHSLLLMTNLPPSELTTDEGTRRRLHPVEFTSLRETDPSLGRRVREPEALRAVLRWIVEGAVRGYAAA